jgi:hypothetical protein
MATITMYNSCNIDDAFSPTFAIVASGSSTTALSAGSTTDPTAAAWTARTASSVAAWNSICYGNKQIVAVAGGPSTKAMSSPTGVTWTARTLTASVNWQSIAYGTRFVTIANGAVDSNVSADGIDWVAGGNLPGADAWYCLAYGEGTFVAVATGGTTSAAYSTDQGDTWHYANTLLHASRNWRTVAYGNGIFMAVPYGSTEVAISNDGIDWSSAAGSLTSRNWSSLTYGGGKWVAVAYGTSIAAYSTDNGATWTETYIGTDYVFNGNFNDSAIGWTLGAGWAHSSNSVTHTSGGGTNTVIPTVALVPVVGLNYTVIYTVTNCTTGTITATIGGAVGTSRSADGTYVEVLTATTTGNLILTPSDDFDGTIDTVKVYLAANWNCISYGESSVQGLKVYTVTGTGTSATAVSYDGILWFNRALSSSQAWTYHCYAPVAWNSNDTLVITNNAIVEATTSQSKFWYAVTGTYGKLKLTNSSTSNAMNFFMGRSSGSTSPAITPGSGLFSIEVDGDWITIGTGTGGASQTMTASYTEYIPSLWVETGNLTGVYEIWNNISGAYGPYMTMFGRDGLDTCSTEGRGNYFVQTPSTTPTAVLSKTGGVTTNQSYYVTCTSTTGILPGASITGTNVPASTVVNRVLGDGVTLELNQVCTASGSTITFTLYNPVQSQFQTTITFGDGVHGNVVPSGARVRQPNIMFSDNTPANYITASHLVDGSIVMGNGGIIDVRTCLFGRMYLNLAQAASVYFRDVGFAYQWALSECYAVDMDGVGNATPPTYWYYTTKWIIRDGRYSTIPPAGYTASTGGSNVAISYTHNISLKNWHKVMYNPAKFTGTSPTVGVNLLDINDGIFENIKIVSLRALIVPQLLHLSNRVNRCTFTDIELYGGTPLILANCNENTFTNITYALNMFNEINNFKTGMRISETPALALLSDNTPYFFKTRTFFSQMNRTDFTESNEYSATAFQGGWQCPDTISLYPTELQPASVTFNWVQREPTFAGLRYEIHRSITQGFTDRDNTTCIMRHPTAATVTWKDQPHIVVTSAATTNIMTFAVNKTITMSGTKVDNFLAKGFQVGDVVDISSTSNTGTFTINTLTATVMTVNETLVAEVATTGQTITGRPCSEGTRYYYRFRKYHTGTPKAFCSVQSGSATLTTTNPSPLDFDGMYTLANCYYDNNDIIIRNLYVNLFATPLYPGATITGPGIQAGTTIVSIDATGNDITISQPTTQVGAGVLISMPVQAGMGVCILNNRPTEGIPYGTTVSSVGSSTSLTMSNNATADVAYLTNGSFTGDATGWTLNSGWAYGTNNVYHSGAGTGTLTPNPALNIVIGNIYQVTYTISNYVAGTIRPTIGGVAGTLVSANGTYTDTITATTTGNLFFTPASSLDATIDDIQIGTAVTFTTFVETPELTCVPNGYPSQTNLCLYSRALNTGATWVASSVTVAAGTYQSPDDPAWANTNACAITATGAGGTLTQTVAGLTAGVAHTASIYVRADQTAAIPDGVAGSISFNGTSTGFTATNDWKKYTVTSTPAGTSADLVITITTNGQVLWATDANVNVGATANAYANPTTTAAYDLRPRAQTLTTMYSQCRYEDYCGYTGNQGIVVTFGRLPAADDYVVNGTFTGGSTGWTLNSGWSYGSNAVAHADGGGTGTLVASGTTIVVSTAYMLTYTISNYVSGTVTPSVGGVAGVVRSGNGTWSEIITTGSSATTALTFTPTTTFNATIDDVRLGIQVAAASMAYTEIYMSTTPGFSPADADIVASTLANDQTHFSLTTCASNELHNITKLAGGGCSTTNALGVLYVSGGNDNIFDNVNIDLSYCNNTTGIPNIHLITPTRDNVFHNIDFGRTVNYLASSHINALSLNSVTGCRIQNIRSKHSDVYYSNQMLDSVVKGMASANAYPLPTVTTFALGGATDGVAVLQTACYGSMFNELYFKETRGALHVVFEDTLGATKPYTLAGSASFSNTGKLYLPTADSSITITWPHKIRGVTGFRDRIIRVLGLDLGNNNNMLQGLKIEYSINGAAFKRATVANLVGEGTLDATNGFDLQIRLTPFTFMKYSRTIGTYTTHTVASPGIITFTGGQAWPVGQRLLYQSTGPALNGLTNNTVYYVNTMPSATTMSLKPTFDGSGIALGLPIAAASVTGVHTFSPFFTAGETIRGVTSFATATIDELYDEGLTGTLVLSNISGAFVPGEALVRNSDSEVRGLNVATNTLALGPQYTSYITALQIATSIDQTKLYPIQRPYITLTGLQPYSEIRVYDNAMNAIAGIENIGNVTTWSSQYDYYGDVTGYIMIVSLGYQVLRLEDIVFGVNGVTLPVQQLLDRQYNNPA